MGDKLRPQQDPQVPLADWFENGFTARDLERKHWAGVDSRGFTFAERSSRISPLTVEPAIGRLPSEWMPAHLPPLNLRTP
jgi:hypothetical protein